MPSESFDQQGPSGVVPVQQWQPPYPAPEGAVHQAHAGAHIPVGMASYSGPRHLQRRFAFDGGPATFFGTALLAATVTILSVGIAYPFALVLRQRWRAKHSFIDGHQLVFTGSAVGLFGNWIKWLFFIVITLGVYSLWVSPRIERWKWEHTGFAGPARVY